MKHPKKHAKHFVPHTKLPLGQSLLVVATFALAAYAGIQLLHAAANIVHTEAESGIVAGNAAKVNDASASGGQAVTFGYAPLPPPQVKAITGGTSIAVVWKASRSTNIKNYEVYRNGSKVATVTPGQGTVRMEKEGRRYIDTNVTRGTTYQYQVRAVNTNNRPSALSNSVSATHPTNTSPVPSITFEYIRASATQEQKDMVEPLFRREIEIWWPKIADALAYPAYTPSLTSIIIETNPDILMGVAGNRLGWNPSQLNNTSVVDLGSGALIHEVTHMINAYGAGETPAWLGEGMADWTRDFFTLERTPFVPTPLDDASTLARGYEQGASFIGFIEKEYDAGFARDINIAAHNGDYDSGFLPDVTGKTEAQLIDEWRNSRVGPAGPIKGIANKCIDVLNSGTADGTKIQLNTCNNANNQNWTLLYLDPDARNIAAGDGVVLGNFSLGVRKCLDILNGGTASGTRIHYWDCNTGIAQRWQVGPNSSLINPNSGKCLSTTSGGSEDGNQLIIADCNGSAGQRWTLPE